MDHFHLAIFPKPPPSFANSQSAYFPNKYNSHCSYLSQGPFVFSSLILSHPRGKMAVQWLRSIPNDGLIHFRTGWNKSCLLVTSQRALSDVLITNSYDFAKPAGVTAFLSRIIGHGLPLSEGDAHRVQRKALIPAFTIKQIRTMYPLMWKKTNVLLDCLEKEVQKYQVPGKKPWQEAGLVEMKGWVRCVSCLMIPYFPRIILIL